MSVTKEVMPRFLSLILRPIPTIIVVMRMLRFYLIMEIRTLPNVVQYVLHHIVLLLGHMWKRVEMISQIAYNSIKNGRKHNGKIFQRTITHF